MLSKVDESRADDHDIQTIFIDADESFEFETCLFSQSSLGGGPAGSDRPRGKGRHYVPILV